MRYTLAAFGIMASAVLAAPMALEVRDGQGVTARGTANTNVVNWPGWGYQNYNDWSKKGGWSSYDDWKKYAEAYCPWEGYKSYDDWWNTDGYDWWRKIGNSDDEWKGKGYQNFDDWFKNVGYKKGYWGKKDDSASSWGKSDYPSSWGKQDDSSWDDDDDDTEWFKDENGEGWHKDDSTGKWEKDSSSDSSKWSKGSDGKWSKTG